MHTSTSSTLSTNGARLDANEIRRVIQAAKARGEIRGGKDAVARSVEKNGAPAAELGGVRSQWMNISPAMALRWLENNFVNRPLDDGVIAAYARDMVIGVWVPTHQGIAFNDKDELIDGQHRLHAIGRSGRTLRMMVTFGLPSVIEGREMTTMDAVDRGRTRSVADQLKIQHGLKHGSVIAMICNSLSQLCCGERTRRMSVAQALETYRAFQSEVDYMIAHRSKHHGLRQAGMLAAFALAIGSEAGGSATIAQLHERLLSGEGLKKNSPIAHLRAFLTSDEAKLITSRLNRGIAELTLQAIWLEQKGRPVAKLEMALDGADHFRALQPARVKKIAELFALPKAA